MSSDTWTGFLCGAIPPPLPFFPLPFLLQPDLLVCVHRGYRTLGSVLNELSGTLPRMGEELGLEEESDKLAWVRGLHVAAVGSACAV